MDLPLSTQIWYNSKLGLRGRVHPKNKRKQDKAKRKPYLMTRLSRFLSASISIVLSKRLQKVSWVSDFFKYTIKKGYIPAQARTWVRNPQEGSSGRTRSGLCVQLPPTTGNIPLDNPGLFFKINGLFFHLEDAHVSPRTVKSLHISEDTSAHPQQIGPLSWADSSQKFRLQLKLDPWF